MSETPSSDPPARGMDSIAHLFLSQSRDRGRIPPTRSEPSSISKDIEDDKATLDSSDANSASLDPVKFMAEKLSSDKEIRYNDSNSESVGNTEDFLLSEATARNQANHESPVRFHGVVFWTDHLRCAEETANRFARQWAQKNEAVGLLRLDTELTELFEFQADRTTASELSTKEWQELLGEGHVESSGVVASLKPGLTELAEGCDILILSADTSLRQQAEDLLEHCRHAVVATTPEPNDMLAAYKAIKRLSPTTWEDKDISVFVCDAEDETSARRIYDKLAKTAWDFLSVNLSWGGWAQPVDNVAERHLAAVKTREEILEELVEALSPHIETAELFTQEQDQLVEELTEGEDRSPFSVLGSQDEKEEEERFEEREMESEAVEEEREDSSEFTVHSSQGGGGEEEKTEERRAKSEDRVEEEVVSETSIPAQSRARHPDVGMPPEGGEVLSPVGVSKLPRSDGDLADALQLALPGWLKGIVTPMILPLSRPGDMEPSVRFLVDGNGRLFVLGVSLTASEDALTKALQGRRWLEDNLSMILSSCPQVRIDRSLEAGVILVAGGEVSFLQESVSQIQEFPIVVKQLHLLQNEAGSSLLVL